MRSISRHLAVVSLLLTLCTDAVVIHAPMEARGTVLLPARAEVAARQQCCTVQGVATVTEQITIVLRPPSPADATACSCFEFSQHLHPRNPPDAHSSSSSSTHLRPALDARCYNIHHGKAANHPATSAPSSLLDGMQQQQQQGRALALGRVQVPGGEATPLRLHLGVPAAFLGGLPLRLSITPCTPADPPPPLLQLLLYPQPTLPTPPSNRKLLQQPTTPNPTTTPASTPPTPPPTPDCSMVVDSLPVNCARSPRRRHFNTTWEIVVVALFCVAAACCALPAALWLARTRGCGAINWARCPGCCCCPDDERDVAVTSLITIHGGALERSLVQPPAASATQQEPGSPMPGKLITYTPRTSISRASTPHHGTPHHGTPRHHHAMSPRSYHGGSDHTHSAPHPHHPFHLDTPLSADAHRSRRHSMESHHSHSSHASSLHPPNFDPPHHPRSSLDILHHTPDASQHPRTGDHPYHDVLHDTILETAMPIPLQLDPKVWPSARLARIPTPNHRPATPTTPPAAAPAAPVLPPIRTSPFAAKPTPPPHTPPSPLATPPARLASAPSAELKLVYQSSLYSNASATLTPLPTLALPPDPPTSAAAGAAPAAQGTPPPGQQQQQQEEGAPPEARLLGPQRSLVLRVGDEGWAEAVAAAAQQARAAMELRAAEEAASDSGGCDSSSAGLPGDDDLCSLSSGHETESEHMCAICLEAYEEGEVLRLLPCGHHFHRHCVDAWLPDHACCPVCRMRLAVGVHTDWSILDDPLHFPPCDGPPSAVQRPPLVEPPASSSARSPASTRTPSLVGAEDAVEASQANARAGG